ncbi:MAG: aminotransferase class I/II-fold pyridoxal phosphate-dependent enzyme [Anaerovoracaceae bacterium]|jgi:arginine/lysine/ornithine decarboxylase
MDSELLTFLTDHAAQRPVSFHMPGHKGADFFRRCGYGAFLDRLIDCDITEIPGADNLFQAEGVIAAVQERYAALYDARDAHLLINGTSGGLIAAMLASVPPGGRLIMARNCHKSVFNGLRLGRIEPIYAYPSVLPEAGISGALEVQEIARCLDAHPEASAVLLPSPNYYGICSDTAAIAELCHRHDCTLIVDQAHGAHLHFFHKFGVDPSLPPSAEQSGADLVVNSIHKTLASLTQSAVLNRCSDRVDRYVLEDRLQMIESTSPSYLLMAFLAVNAEILEQRGREALTGWKRALDLFYEQAGDIPGLRLIAPARGMDHTKINLDLSARGLDGAALERQLNARGIFPELHSGRLLMLMSGIGTTSEHVERTLTALRDIAAGADEAAEPPAAASFPLPSASAPENRPAMLTPPQRQTWAALEEAAGRISAACVIPYPPGIPILCPGETVTAEVIAHCLRLRRTGENVIGINDRGEILVGCDDSGVQPPAM